MNPVRPLAYRRLNTPVYWLLGLAVVCLLAVLGVELVFEGLQGELREKQSNEQARLFMGDEIVRSIGGIENHMYRLLAATRETEVARERHGVAEHIDNAERSLKILEQGGTLQRVVQLNIEGEDEMVRSMTYRPEPGASGHVLELIEISPLLEKMDGLADNLEYLVLRRIDCDLRLDNACRQRVQPDIDLFLKLLPPQIERIGENANRLFHDGTARLRDLEEQLRTQAERLKQIKMALLALVIILSGITGMMFMGRLHQANDQLRLAIDEMRATKDEAERASRAKSEFVSRMSHELRTPLNAIIGFADLLEDEPLSPSHKHYVNLINSSGRHLMELINAVLDHAKIESGSLTLESIAFDLRAAIDAVEAIVSERASAKGLDFDVTVDAALPRFVVGDPTRLRQVVINLLNNAVKFTTEGGVELRLAAAGDRLAFDVRDTGIGMDEAALGRLFQPFSQADDSITRKYGGTGLGLLISKDLIEAMGGGIAVESRPGVGSTFRFWIPLQLADAPSLPTPAGAPLRGGELAALIGGRVLLVDDNRVNQQLAGAMLERLGLDFACANNGQEALQRLADERFALVLMDMEMPVMDGIAATQALRTREYERDAPARLPVIAMTANALQEDRERCFAAGMDGYVAKPVNLSALQAEIRRLFGNADASAAKLPSAHDASAAPVYNRDEALERLGDAELLAQIVDMFVADVPGYFAAIDTALDAGDGPALARAAHTIKGLCATFSATPAENAAAALEHSAREQRLDVCAAQAIIVREQVDALLRALRA